MALSQLPDSVAAPIYRLRWLALALVFSASMISYIDRQALALLKPTLEKEFHWTDSEFAHIGSAFQVATLCSILAVGWFVDRIGLRRSYALGVGVWSFAGVAHALVTTVTGFMSVRAVLGVAEAVGTPAAVKAVGAWFHGRDRSLALGVMNTAPNIGAVIAPLVIPPLALVVGWKLSFAITGALGFVWIVAWLCMPRVPAEPVQVRPVAEKSSIRRILFSRRAWTIAILKFLTDFVWGFMLFWAPDLFHKRYGLDTIELALPVAVVFMMAGAGAIFGGWLSSRLLRGGASLNVSRKAPMLVSAILALPAPLVIMAPDLWVGVALVGTTLAAHQIFSTNIFGLATDLFPNRDVGIVVGLGATFGNLSALGMLELTGFVLDRTGSYTLMLVLCGVAYAIALGVLQLLAPNIDRISKDSLGAAALAGDLPE